MLWLTLPWLWICKHVKTQKDIVTSLTGNRGNWEENTYTLHILQLLLQAQLLHTSKIHQEMGQQWYRTTHVSKAEINVSWQLRMAVVLHLPLACWGGI